MNNSKNSNKQVTITNKDCGINKGFSSLQDAEWLQNYMFIEDLEDDFYNHLKDEENLSNEIPF